MHKVINIQKNLILLGLCLASDYFLGEFSHCGFKKLEKIGGFFKKCNFEKRFKEWKNLSKVLNPQNLKKKHCS